MKGGKRRKRERERNDDEKGERGRGRTALIDLPDPTISPKERTTLDIQNAPGIESGLKETAYESRRGVR